MKGGVPSEMMIKHYEERANQCAFIIGEACWVTPEGDCFPYSAGIVTPEQKAGWKKLVDALHAKGGKIYLQLAHGGR